MSNNNHVYKLILDGFGITQFQKEEIMLIIMLEIIKMYLKRHCHDVQYENLINQLTNCLIMV